MSAESLQNVRPRPGQGERILLVDDDPDARESLMRRLTRRGYQVDTVEGASQALDALQKDCFDLMLLDHNMPGMTGLDLLQLLRATRSATDLPVVMLTAQADSGHLTRALELGANDYLTKPVDIDVATARIGSQLARRKAETALRQSELRYALAARASNDGLWDWDFQTGAVYYSERWCEMLGYGIDQFRHDVSAWLERIHPADASRVRKLLDAHLADGESFETEYRIRHRDDTYRWVVSKGQAARTLEGTPLRIAGSMSDVTAQKVVDSLTGLATRVCFEERLADVIERYSRDPKRLYAVLFFDLDRFKLINDNFGHFTGDCVLKEMAVRLTQSVRSALPARFGGDEFALLIEDISDPDVAISVGNRLIEVAKQPMEIEGRLLCVSVSVGVAICSPDVTVPEQILRNADLALYRAKQVGRNRLELFHDSLRTEALQRTEIEAELRVALAENQLEVHYQPSVRLQGGQIIGFEALVRWRHPTRGLVEPLEFIPIAEESDLIIELGAWVLRTACQQLAELRSRTSEFNLVMAVNVSARQLYDPTFVQHVQQCLSDEGIPASSLCLEITESVILDENDTTQRSLWQIKDLGISVLIDDFGTGYSSLARLSQLPVNGLKIDRSFVKSMSENSKNLEVVRSILALAEATGLDVVAEGIEDQGQAAELLSMGCEKGQGYFYSRAVPSEDTEGLLKDPATLP